ncbi:MAG TPA: hypothetical protein VGX03_25140 [Candidatus Binatia bacterium]|jgi:hypothetical protein|nr:hypothetical protein [Candidatus Binatia bacterium]
MKKSTVAIIVVGLWLCAAASSSFAEADFQRETLRGLPGVWVVVEKLPAELEQSGLTQGQVQTDAEDRLRKAGITILTQEECWQTPGMPWLYITVALLKAGTTTYAATVGAVLNQEITLTRNPQIKAFGSTWDAGVHLGAIGTESLATVRDSVGSLVDKFIADYQAVNLKDMK